MFHQTGLDHLLVIILSSLKRIHIVIKELKKMTEIKLFDYKQSQQVWFKIESAIFWEDCIITFFPKCENVNVTQTNPTYEGIF